MTHSEIQHSVDDYVILSGKFNQWTTTILFFFKPEFHIIFHSINLDVKWQLIASHTDRPSWA